MKKQILTFALCVVGFASNSVAAQEAPKRVAVFDDWYVYEAGSPKECFAVTAPTKTVNSRGGAVVDDVKRGDIRLFVFYRPSANVKGQVAFTGGYPFAKGRPIQMEIDTTNYDLSTTGEWAWPASPEDDTKIVTAMRRGATAIITAQSSRPTVTKDTFSLKGFTASIEDAAQRCPG